MPLALTAAKPLEGELVDEIPDGARRLKQLRDGTFRGGPTPPGHQGTRAKGFERIPRIKRLRVSGRGAAVAGAAALTPMAVRDTQRLHQHPDRRPSAGRLAAGANFGAYHAATAAKPGQKGRAIAAMAPAVGAGYVANKYAMQHAAPHLMNLQHAVAYGHPSGPHMLRAGKALLPAVGVQLAAGALITRHNASMGRYKEQTMAKSDTRYTDASPGRYAVGALFGAGHGAVAGKPGHKLGAAAVEGAPTLAAAPLAFAGGMHGKPALQAAGGAIKYGGRLVGVNANQRSGRLKKQTVRKDMLPTQVRYVVARTADGRYAGNGNGLTFVQVVPRHRKGSDTAPTVVHRGPGPGPAGRAAVSVAHGHVAKAGGLGRGFAGALKRTPLAEARGGKVGQYGLSRTERALNTGGGNSITTRGGRARRQVLANLDRVSTMPKPTSVPRTNLTGPLASRLPAPGSATAGRRLL